MRPVLLLPRGISEHLSQAQLGAVLEHELAHWRRRDNLTAAAHMLVEAVFWFHPLVWWIGARLVEERERACDEAVVRAGHDGRTYAEGILNVCERYVASALKCAAGISGADLKQRVVEIARNRVMSELPIQKKILLGTFALSTLLAPIIFGAAAQSVDEPRAVGPHRAELPGRGASRPNVKESCSSSSRSRPTARSKTSWSSTRRRRSSRRPRLRRCSNGATSRQT